MHLCVEIFGRHIAQHFISFHSNLHAILFHFSSVFLHLLTYDWHSGNRQPDYLYASDLNWIGHTHTHARTLHAIYRNELFKYGSIVMNCCMKYDSIQYKDRTHHFLSRHWRGKFHKDQYVRQNVNPLQKSGVQPQNSVQQIFHNENEERKKQ